MDYSIFHQDLTQRLESSRLNNNEHIALLMFCIDHISEMNDTFGPGTSEQIVLHTEEIFRKHLPSNAIFASLGDDRFTIAFTNLTHDIESLATKLLALIQHPVRIGPHDVFISASAGLALFPEDANTSDGLIQASETALRWAKASNQHAAAHRYTRTVQIEASHNYRRINELLGAIDRQEYVNFYQPKVDLKTGRVVGCEALTRWNHPIHGILEPDAFIPVLEEEGLITALGEWTIHDACLQLKRWHASGIMLDQIAVNISAQQFCSPNFVQMVDTAIRTYGLQPHQLELELTESCLLENVEHAIQVFHALKEVGVHLSIDDFGIGYSSLRYLKDIPLDALKIDRSFVAEITTNAQVSAICQSMVQLGHHLNLNVIAEGVESTAQLEHVRGYGCDVFQGFLCSRALPENVFAQWLPKDLLWTVNHPAGV